MNCPTDWKHHWNQRSVEAQSDFEFDRGVAPSDKEIEALSEAELLRFIDPKPADVIVDAGCGTGANMFLLNSRVKQIVGLDYSAGAVERCRKRIELNKIGNVAVAEGTITQMAMPNCSVDKVVCLSVLQYLSDRDVNLAFAEFARVLKLGGLIVLHVKNLSSLYLSTLWVAQRLKLLLGKGSRLSHYRTFGWYARALARAGFEIVDYNSFSLFLLPKMPKSLEVRLQRFEFHRYSQGFLRLAWLRRRGADLKIKAKLIKAAA